MTPQLKKVLDKIKNHSIFIKNDFRLAGGTALSYHINHRLSEDLDFFISGKLPKDDIKDFILFCIEQFGEEKIIPLEASANQKYEFEIASEDVEDYQQDWSINGVKVTFFDCSSNVGNKDIFSDDQFVKYGDVKIMSVASIFKMKSLMFYKRLKIRDYFDLYTLYNDEKLPYNPKDTIDLIQKYELMFKGEDGLKLFYMSLEENIKSYDKNNDEPLYTLIDNAPNFEQLSTGIMERIKLDDPKK